MKARNLMATGAVVWGAWFWINHVAPEVMWTILENGWALMDLIWAGWEAINGFLPSLVPITNPVVWAAAGLAAPIVAGWTLWYKLADVMKIEKKWLRALMTAGWIWAWAALSSSVLAPYLTAWAIVSVLAKPGWEATKLISKFGGKTLSSASSAGVSWTVETVKSAAWLITAPFRWWVKWGKKGWTKPKVIPYAA